MSEAAPRKQEADYTAQCDEVRAAFSSPRLPSPHSGVGCLLTLRRGVQAIPAAQQLAKVRPPSVPTSIRHGAQLTPLFQDGKVQEGVDKLLVLEKQARNVRLRARGSPIRNDSQC